MLPIIILPYKTLLKQAKAKGMSGSAARRFARNNHTVKA